MPARLQCPATCRAPMRYTLAPKGYNDHSADFTIYVSHMKSGSTGSGLSGSNGFKRNDEAVAIRNDAYGLGPNAHIIYAGDYNLNDSTEAAYQTMISTTVHLGIGKAIDTLNPANYWDDSSTYKSLLTESADYLQYRDDVQYVTDPMTIHTPSDAQPGMKLLSATLGAFGNGGSVYHKPVTDSSNSTALAEFNNTQEYPPGYRSTVLNALLTATDHLPVVADYSFASAVGAPGDFDRSGAVNSADYALWRSTFGSTTDLVADGNHNGVVDAADYIIWRRNAASGAGAALLDSETGVPEPATWALMLVGCLAGLRRSRLRA